MKLKIELKRILMSLFVAMSVLTSMADTGNMLNQADVYFKEGKYQEAKDMYSKIKGSLMSDNIKKNIAKCDKLIDLQLRARAKKIEGDDEGAYLLYLQLLSKNGTDKEAKEFLSNYSRPSQAAAPVESERPKVGESPRHASSPVIAEKKEEKHPDVEYFYMQDGKKVYCYMNPERPQMTYHEALEYCRNLELAGKRGWRLPTMDEMMRFYNDYPHEKGKLIWVGYKGVVINNMTVEENEANSNMKYCPCIDGRELVVHPFRVNSRNEVVAGEVMRHHFFPVRTE